MVQPAHLKYMYTFVAANLLLTLFIWALIARFQWAQVAVVATGYSLLCFVFIPWCRNAKLYYFMGVVGTLFQSILVMLSVAPQLPAAALGIGLLLVAWILLTVYQLGVLQSNHARLITGGMLNVKHSVWDLSRPVALDYSKHGLGLWLFLLVALGAIVPYAIAIGFWLNRHPSEQVTLTASTVIGAAFLMVQAYTSSLHAAHICYFLSLERQEGKRILLPGRSSGE
ncbi:MAG: hypothetical protein KIS88_01760 [Anaerolineales bacterium]|nr:hypothetical protein [Anaerolineales bacterium]